MSPEFIVRKIVLIAVAAIGLLARPTAVGANSFFFWDGGSQSSNDLGDAQNWSTNTAPPNDGTAAIELPDSPRPFPTAFQTWQYEGITFTGSSTAYAIIGAPLSLGVGGVVNLSPRVQIIENDVNLSTTQFWAAAAGPW
jgi:hypothetical protein